MDRRCLCLVNWKVPIWECRFIYILYHHTYKIFVCVCVCVLSSYLSFTLSFLISGPFHYRQRVRYAQLNMQTYVPCDSNSFMCFFDLARAEQRKYTVERSKFPLNISKWFGMCILTLPAHFLWFYLLFRFFPISFSFKCRMNEVSF